MHHFGAAVVPTGIAREHIEPYVEKVLAPSQESQQRDGIWDWWQVGGRWTGVWGEYDPEKDPRNLDRGEPKWPTQWVAYDGDIITVAALLNNPPLQRPGTIFLPDGVVLQQSRWDSDARNFVDIADDDWQARVAEALEPFRGEALVVVDYHS